MVIFGADGISCLQVMSHSPEGIVKAVNFAGSLQPSWPGKQATVLTVYLEPENRPITGQVNGPECLFRLHVSLTDPPFTFTLNEETSGFPW